MDELELIARLAIEEFEWKVTEDWDGGLQLPNNAFVQVFLNGLALPRSKIKVMSISADGITYDIQLRKGDCVHGWFVRK